MRGRGVGPTSLQNWANENGKCAAGARRVRTGARAARGGAISSGVLSEDEHVQPHHRQGPTVGENSTPVERQTRLVHLLHLPQRDGELDGLGRGSEMARHLTMTTTRSTLVDFCEATRCQASENRKTPGPEDVRALSRDRPAARLPVARHRRRRGRELGGAALRAPRPGVLGSTLVGDS
jgi:hypothetical protein